MSAARLPMSLGGTSNSGAASWSRRRSVSRPTYSGPNHSQYMAPFSRKVYGARAPLPSPEFGVKALLRQPTRYQKVQFGWEGSLDSTYSNIPPPNARRRSAAAERKPAAAAGGASAGGSSRALTSSSPPTPGRVRPQSASATLRSQKSALELELQRVSLTLEHEQLKQRIRKLDRQTSSRRRTKREQKGGRRGGGGDRQKPRPATAGAARVKAPETDDSAPTYTTHIVPSYGKVRNKARVRGGMADASTQQSDFVDHKKGGGEEPVGQEMWHNRRGTGKVMLVGGFLKARDRKISPRPIAVGLEDKEPRDIFGRSTFRSSSRGGSRDEKKKNGQFTRFCDLPQHQLGVYGKEGQPGSSGRSTAGSQGK